MAGGERDPDGARRVTERPQQGVAEIPVTGELAKVEAEVEEDLAELEVDAPLVAIVMGSNLSLIHISEPTRPY